MPNPAHDGRLAALSPQHDGRVVKLADGDHDIFYGIDEKGKRTLIRGYDRHGRVFTIRDSDEKARTPPAL